MRCSKTSFGIDCRLSGHGSFGSSQRHGLTIVTLRRMPNITQPRRWHSKQWHMEMRTLILGEAHLRKFFLVMRRTTIRSSQELEAVRATGSSNR